MNFNTHQAPSAPSASSKLNAAASSSLDTACSRLDTPSSQLDTASSASNFASNFVSALLDGAFSDSKPSASIMEFCTLILLDDAKTPDEFWALRSFICQTLPDSDLAAALPAPAPQDFPELDIKAMVAELLPGAIAKVLASGEFTDNLEDLLSSYEHEDEASPDQPPETTPVPLDSADLTNSRNHSEYGPHSPARSLRD